LPNSYQHLAEANHNEKIYHKLVKMKEYSWSAVLLFYTAVHHAEAIRSVRYQANSMKHEDSLGHKERRRLIESWLGKENWEKYDHLEQSSIEARYKCKKFEHDEIEELYRNFFLPLINKMQEFRQIIDGI